MSCLLPSLPRISWERPEHLTSFRFPDLSTIVFLCLAISPKWSKLAQFYIRVFPNSEHFFRSQFYSTFRRVTKINTLNITVTNFLVFTFDSFCLSFNTKYSVNVVHTNPKTWIQNTPNITHRLPQRAFRDSQKSHATRNTFILMCTGVSTVCLCLYRML